MREEFVKKRKLAQSAALAWAIAVMLSGCSGTGGLQDKVSPGETWTHAAVPGGEAPVLTGGPLSLYLENGMSVRVEDRRYGTVWSTNAPAVTEAAATEDQFVLKYYDSSGTLLQMGSKKDSVDKGQAEAFLEDGSLYVRYRLGDYEKTVQDVPQALTDRRFREKFLQKLDPDGQAEMESYYKFYETEDAWRIKAKGKNNFKQILRIMAETGYTEEDLARDNADFGISSERVSRAFFTIVLQYTPGENGLTVSAPTDLMEFSADFPPYELTLLEGFGLLGQGEDGYVFLPDGSGALMAFSRSFEGRTELALPVYGPDLTQKSAVLQNNRQDNRNVLLPVFGMKDGDGSYLAVIEGAESKATIHAYPGGTYFARNAAYASFRLIDKDKVYLSGNDAHSATVLVFENRLYPAECRVDYLFLAPGGGYPEMAAAYRERLAGEGRLNVPAGNAAAGVPLLVETLDGLTGYKNFLGISYIGVIGMTTYAENRAMMEDLIAGGITDLSWKLTGWFNGGYYHDYIGKIRLQKELGGRSQWDDMAAYAKDNGITLYPDVEFQTFARGSAKFIPLLDASRGLDYSSVRIPVLSPARQAENEGNGLTPAWLNVRSPALLQGLTETFLRQYARLGAGGISLRSSGSALYSDFNERRTVDRTEAEALMQAHLKAVRESVGSLMVNEGFAYALPYADVISDVPLGSSGFSMTQEDVPFLQMVLHGSSILYGDAVNLAANADEYLLRSIEYGVYLHYQLTACESSRVKNTELTTNYSSGYADWKAPMLEAYASEREALAPVADALMTGHRRIAGGVYRTDYGNGVRIYVNYNGSDVSVEDGIVPAGSFLVAGTAG